MDTIIIDGDQVKFNPSFPPAAFIGLAPVAIEGSGTATVSGNPVCLEGDEKKVELDVKYTAGPYVTPGEGTLKIIALAGDQLAQKTCNGEKLILKGSLFDAEFTVKSPAKQPTPNGPVPDATPKYMGKGTFESTNAIALAT